MHSCNAVIPVSRHSINLIWYHLGCRFSKSQFLYSNTQCVNDYGILKCLSDQNIQEAQRLLNEIPDRGVVGWTSLLTKYSKNGFLKEAQLLFNIMPERNIVTYNSLLSAYVQSGRINDARYLFEVMPDRNVVSWTSFFCGLMNAGQIVEARKLFDLMPERNTVTWNSMVVGLIRNGSLDEARRIFDEMPLKSQVTWNIMINGYVENHTMEEARNLFEQMNDPNVITWTSLISGYCRYGDIEEGLFLFRSMPNKNIVSWTAMIGGFAWNGFYEKALLLFLEMQENYSIQPNGETLISLAYACVGLGISNLGKQLHAHLIVNNWISDDHDGRLMKSLIHMYSTFNTMDFAEHIYIKNLNFFSIQSCNSMINGYIRIGQLEKARNLFEHVPCRDKITWTSMINGYLLNGQVEIACRFFNNMQDKDEIVWTTMISGHVQNELFDKAMFFFMEMRRREVLPLKSTYAVLIGAAGAMCYLDQGKQFHCMLMKTQPKLDLILENSLISMYAKCGEINESRFIFSNMISRDLITWNSMIMGFSHHGLPNEALKLFESMRESNFQPNSVTFLGILSACSHAGLVDRGWKLYNAMSDYYGISPCLEHYICIINLLGRAGKVKEAEDFVLRLPFEKGLAIWGALLGVCGFGEKNADIANRAVEQVLKLDSFNAPAYVALCNIYAATGRHVEERILRREMGVKGVRKVPGCSWILLKGRVHVFFSGDRSHPQSNEIFSVLVGVSEYHSEGGEEIRCGEIVLGHYLID